jgi:ribosomal protein S18 acetylase RimI-like enzyme
MSIFKITSDMWDEIHQLQAEVYADMLLEELDVLKDKWKQSPDCCFVYKTADRTDAYLLSHSWNNDSPPKLFQKLPGNSHGDILFLHDLAVSNRVQGKGVGRVMVKNLISIARERQFRKIILVSVQGSVSFWSKLGFEVVECQTVCSGYGSDAKLMSLKLTD